MMSLNLNMFMRMCTIQKNFEACKGSSIYSLVASAPTGKLLDTLQSKLEDFPGISEIGDRSCQKNIVNIQ